MQSLTQSIYQYTHDTYQQLDLFNPGRSRRRVPNAGDKSLVDQIPSPSSFPAPDRHEQQRGKGPPSGQSSRSQQRQGADEEATSEEKSEADSGSERTSEEEESLDDRPGGRPDNVSRVMANGDGPVSRSLQDAISSNSIPVRAATRDRRPIPISARRDEDFNMDRLLEGSALVALSKFMQPATNSSSLTGVFS